MVPVVLRKRIKIMKTIYLHCSQNKNVKEQGYHNLQLKTGFGSLS